MVFSRPESWRGWPFPFPGDLPNPGIELRSSALWEDSLPAEPQGKLKNPEVGSLPSPADLPNPGIKLGSPALQEDSLPAEPQGKPENHKDLKNKEEPTSKLPSGSSSDSFLPFSSLSQ